MSFGGTFANHIVIDVDEKAISMDYNTMVMITMIDKSISSYSDHDNEWQIYLFLGKNTNLY